MNTSINPDGTVTVRSRGHHRMSELLDAAAQAFAEHLERPVEWPALVTTHDDGDDGFLAIYQLPTAGERDEPSTLPKFLQAAA